jgi:biotin operon repressor
VDNLFKGFKPRQDLSGFTAIPNEWFDEVLAKIDNLAELKIVQAVFRKTYGWVENWHNGEAVFKLEDGISYSQFAELTGLSSASIAEGIKRAIEHGYIIQLKKGNFYTSESSVYKIRTIDDKLPEKPLEKPVLPTLDSKPDITLDSKPDITLDSKAVPTLDSKVTIETIKEKEIKKESHREVYSTNDLPKSRGQKMFDSYKAKEIAEYNANDLCYYFSEKYQDIIGVKYGRVLKKDRSQMKQLLDDYGADHVVKAIDYLVQNYHSLIQGYPSIAVLYGFRNTIFPSAVKGTAGKLSVRESRLTDKDIEKAKGSSNVIAW